MTWLAAAGAVLALGALWLRRRFVAIAVRGASMSPTLRSGDRVLVRLGHRRLHRHAIVVIAEPHTDTGWRDNPPAGRDPHATGWFIKRVAALAGDPYPATLSRPGTVAAGHFIAIGDNPHSRDSKQYGPCPIHQILGVVIRRMT